MNSSRRSRSTIGVIGGVVAAAAAGGLVQSRPSTQRWFSSLRTPRLQPPDAVFGPVWSVLYTGIAWNGSRLFAGADTSDRREARRLWVAQLVLNGAWTPLFFGLKRPGLALVDIVALDAATVALRRNAAVREESSRHWALDPYLAWIAFATYLNASIWWLNRDRT